MTMKDELRFKFDQSKGNNEHEGKTDISSYESHGMVRNICFTLEDGSRKFLNYAYLVSGDIDADKKTITLFFTTDTLILKGILLDKLFDELMKQTPKEITAMGSRYSHLQENKEPQVTEVLIKVQNN